MNQSQSLYVERNKFLLYIFSKMELPCFYYFREFAFKQYVYLCEYAI